MSKVPPVPQNDLPDGVTYSQLCGDIIRNRMSVVGLSLADMAAELGMSAVDLDDALNGAAPLYVDAMVRIAAQFDCSVTELMPGGVRPLRSCPPWCTEHTIMSAVRRHHGRDRRVYIHREYPEKSVAASVYRDDLGLAMLELHCMDDETGGGQFTLTLTATEAFRIAAALGQSANELLAEVAR